MWQFYYELERTVAQVAARAGQGLEDAAHGVVAVGERGVAFVGREYTQNKARFDCIFAACEESRSRAWNELVQRFRSIELDEVLGSVFDALEKMILIMLSSTTVGTGGGAVAGAFVGGVGAVPGAAIGFQIGVSVGLWVLEFMGLAAIADYVVQGLPEALKLYRDGLREAWNAPVDPLSGVTRPDYARTLHVRVATRMIADGHVRMVMLILMGIVACLLTKLGTEALARSAAGGSLGEKFAGWLVRNAEKLKADPELQPRATRILQPANEARLPEPARGSTDDVMQRYARGDKGLSYPRTADQFKPDSVYDPNNPTADQDQAIEQLRDQLDSNGGRAWNDRKINQILDSGSNFGTKDYAEGDPMFKIGSADLDPNTPSPYLLDQNGMNGLMDRGYVSKDLQVLDRAGVKQSLALPCYNSAETIFPGRVTASGTTTGVTSRISPATELFNLDDGDGGVTAGKLFMNGGGSQVSLPPAAVTFPK